MFNPWRKSKRLAMVDADAAVIRVPRDCITVTRERYSIRYYQSQEPSDTTKYTYDEFVRYGVVHCGRRN